MKACLHYHRRQSTRRCYLIISISLIKKHRYPLRLKPGSCAGGGGGDALVAWWYMASHTDRLWLHSLAAELYRLTGGHIDPAHRLLMGSPDEGRKMCLWLTVISRKWSCPPLAGSLFDLPATIIARFQSYNFARRVSLWGSSKCKVFSVCEISRFAPHRFGFLLHLGGIVSVQRTSQHFG